MCILARSRARVERVARSRERPLWKCHGGTSAYGISTSDSRSPRSPPLPPLALYLTTLAPSPLALLYVACKSQQTLLPSLSVLLATPTPCPPPRSPLPSDPRGRDLARLSVLPPLPARSYNNDNTTPPRASSLPRHRLSSHS